jgi:acetyl esterase/lipase
MMTSTLCSGIILIGAGLVMLATLSSCAGPGDPPPSHAGAEMSLRPVQHVYKTVGEKQLVLKVFPPADAKPGEARPAIVFFFGGGFTMRRQAQFEPQCRYFASRGMVAMTADYRVGKHDGVKPPDCCADGRSAIRWIRAHAAELGVDPARIVASGGSAGGTIAAMTGLIDEAPPAGEPQVSSRPNAMVLFNPALVYAPIDGREPRPDARIELYTQRWGVSSFLETSAWHHVSANAPPTQVHQGDRDAICLVELAHRFEEKMRAHGVRCEVEVYEGQGHGFFAPHREEGRYFRQTLAATDRFLASLGYLQGEPTVDEE